MKTKATRSSTDTDGPSIRIAWKDPQSILASWLVTEEYQQEIEQEFAIPFHELPLVLRLYDVTYRIEIKNDGLDSYTDYDINYRASNWILYGVMEGCKYCVDLGIRMVDGRFYSLSRSEILS
ncbi:DUF4912 domain-containing protein [Brevibacillus laterosporus]|uniref:DUF4912 domain-containing protein n=1 Tax=Brevibacillus laterosporus TaxID=1465 RepID=A0A518VE15_BRELA|nr:DUF4912 domain-containing protein [Brevibacillus laterosporus]QDX95238.1 DUF4912 domain-containing protein [Brevibacillus laterosporus]